MSNAAYTIGTQLDENEILEAKVLAAKGGFRGLGAWVTELVRKEIKTAQGDPSPGHSVKAKTK